MSITVALEDLEAEVARRGPGYLLSSDGTTRPHVMQLRFTVDGAELRTTVGRSAAANIGSQPAVTLLWPPETEGGYSLIVDGEATIDQGPDGSAGGPVAVIAASWAVLHRPA